MSSLWAPVVEKFVSGMRYVVLRAMIARSPRQRMQGIEVSDLICSGRTELLFSKLGAALALIASVDPYRFDRVERDLRRIVFLESGPEFWPEARACVLNDVGDLSTEEVALHVVHEAAHARLWGAGFRYAPALRARIERICVSAELAFLQKVSGSTRLIEETERKLDQKWWTPDQRRARTAEDLERIPTQTWIHRPRSRREER